MDLLPRKLTFGCYQSTTRIKNHLCGR